MCASTAASAATTRLVYGGLSALVPKPPKAAPISQARVAAPPPTPTETATSIGPSESRKRSTVQFASSGASLLRALTIPLNTPR